MNLKEAVKGFSKKEKRMLFNSFDIIGDIAIIDVPKGLKKKKKQIAEAIIKIQPYIKVVAEKVGIHSGKYRTQSLRVILGEKRLETEHKESGLRMRVNVAACYFTPRLSAERLRIAEQVKKNEAVLVMFSGVAPYQLVLSKHSRAKSIMGIEINPNCHKYAVENVKLNKCVNVKLYKGSAGTITPKLKQKFDRIIMPLPKTAYKFLPTAIKALKKNGIIHYYCFRKEDELETAKNDILKACKKLNRKCKILSITKCGANAPRSFRVCVDGRVR